MTLPSKLSLARDIIVASDFILITAGAGMSADSGLPTFRGPEGFWRAYPPMAKLGLTFPETSNPRWFHKDPSFAWGFFGHRHQLYTSTAPHFGYSILQNWCKHKEHFVFTSNVDGHFAKAGFDEERIAECHGNIHVLQCLDTYKCSLDLWPMGKVEVNKDTFRAEEPLPRCQKCGGLARPNILMFGDIGWVSERTDAQMRRLEEKLGMKKWRICVIEIGAGEAVYTVRAFGERLVEREKAKIIRINPDESRFTDDDGVVLIKLGALEGLKQIDKLMHY
jgi:NAD-dependent SIR2 family protein deacetylase